MTESTPPIDPRTFPPIDVATGWVLVFVECPRGSIVKDKLDPRSGHLRFHKHMPRAMAWPFAYGFVCGTRAEDGDPLDAVVLSERPLKAGSIVPCRVLGLIEADQTVGANTHRNDRVIGADAACSRFGGLRALDELTAGEIDAVQAFFVEYNLAQGRRFLARGRLGPQGALDTIRSALTH